MIKRKVAVDGLETRKGVWKINKTKRYWFFDFDKPPTRLKKKRHKLPMLGINEG